MIQYDNCYLFSLNYIASARFCIFPLFSGPRVDENRLDSPDCERSETGCEMGSAGFETNSRHLQFVY